MNSDGLLNSIQGLVKAKTMERRPRQRAKTMIEPIKQLIIREARRCPEKSRETLADEIIAEIKHTFPREIPPTWETVIKKISEARNYESPLEEPWSIGKLKENPLPADAVAIILKIQKVRNEVCAPNVTVRQAFWISQLFKAITELRGLDRADEDVLLSYIDLDASKYAELDMYSEITGKPLNTKDFDSNQYWPDLSSYKPIKPGESLIDTKNSEPSIDPMFRNELWKSMQKAKGEERARINRKEDK